MPVRVLYRLVRRTGLEPACLSAYAPQAYVSTSSTTGAHLIGLGRGFNRTSSATGPISKLSILAALGSRLLTGIAKQCVQSIEMHGSIWGMSTGKCLNIRKTERVGEAKVLYYNEMATVFFLFTLISGLLAMSYWAGVADLEDFGDEEDLY